MNPDSNEIGNDEAYLRELNENIGKKELAGDDKAFFDKLLTDDLIFRRAGGSVVGKEKFLADLTTGQFERLETWVDAINIKVAPSTDPNVPIKELSAVADVTVIAQRVGEEAPGKYRNIRMFYKREGEEWKVRAWINTKVPDR